MGMIPTYLAFLDIGGGEFIVIVLVALVLYGGRLPEVARTVGRTVGHIKRQADELTRDFREEFHEASRGEPRTRRPYEPPKRVVPQRDPRALSDGELHDEPGAHHATGDGSSVEPDEEPGVDDLAGAPSEELRRAEQDFVGTLTPRRSSDPQTTDPRPGAASSDARSPGEASVPRDDGSDGGGPRPDPAE